MLPESFTPLPEYIASRKFNLKKCLRTAAVVAKCIVLLHQRELSHSNLSGDKIFVKTTAKVSFDTVFFRYFPMILGHLKTTRLLPLAKLFSIYILEDKCETFARRYHPQTILQNFKHTSRYLFNLEKPCRFFLTIFCMMFKMCLPCHK